MKVNVMNNFSKAKIGDICYSILKGEGRIIDILPPQSDPYRIRVHFLIDWTEEYTFDGRNSLVDLFPELYKTKVKIERAYHHDIRSELAQAGQPL